MIIPSSKLKQLAGEGKAVRPMDELLACERETAAKVVAAINAQTAELARSIAQALAAQKPPVVNLPNAPRPSYRFTIDRDADGLIVGIRATPE